MYLCRLHTEKAEARGSLVHKNLSQGFKTKTTKSRPHLEADGPCSQLFVRKSQALMGALSWPVLLEDLECATWEMAGVVVYLPHKHLDLSLSPGTHIGSQGWWHMFVIPASVGKDWGNSGVRWPVSLVMISRPLRGLCQTVFWSTHTHTHKEREAGRQAGIYNMHASNKR